MGALLGCTVAGVVATLLAMGLAWKCGWGRAAAGGGGGAPFFQYNSASDSRMQLLHHQPPALLRDFE